MIYLDHAATTAPRREVLEAMWPWLTHEFGNASSHHERGQRAARALDDARERVAAVLGARPGEIIFTSGGTEADNLAVKGIALARRERQPGRNRVLISAIEHDAVLESARSLAQFDGFTAAELPVDGSGFVSPGILRAFLTDDASRPGALPSAGALPRHPKTAGAGEPVVANASGTAGSDSVAMASVMLANNEVGTVQNMSALAEVAAEFGVPLHTDAVQAAGTLPLRVTDLGVSALTLAGHKIGTPQGVGLLWVKRGTPLRSLMSGGGHERGRRSGTSNVAGAVGLATALELAERERKEYTARVAALRDRLIDGILGAMPGTLLTGPDPRKTVNLQETGVAANATAKGTHVTDPDSADIAAGASAATATAAASASASAGLNGNTRLATNASFCFPGVNGETVLVDLENQGVLVSSGSACATGSSEPSHVLTAMGVPAEVATTSVRFSLGRETTENDIDTAIRATAQIIAELRS
ncbi:cysteine desulfurase family protein [Kocuria carniphila]|uniref:cysteine desulfurase family protein n=1 Tax=Kocuria carniphila TaxID=262208 RepID=UPI0028E42AF2|nr:cysteine desulfurase family protein [Kocuria carniphila]